MKRYVGDLETNYKDDIASVWLSGLLSLDDDFFIYHRSLQGTLEFLESINDDVKLYYHNLKFDGSFWLVFLSSLGYTDKTAASKNIPRSFSYIVDNMGKWYAIDLFLENRHTVKFIDSFKLIPLSVANIGKTFGGEQKGEIDYSIYRDSNYNVTDEEIKYLYNDLRIVKNGLLSFGDLKGITIGSQCFSEYKDLYRKKIKHITNLSYGKCFPRLSKIKIDESFGSKDADEYIRKSYYGGWCYLNPRFQSQELRNGFVLDVNSLYPFIMHSSSGTTFPIGTPTFKKLDSVIFTPVESDGYYFVRFRAIFDLKPNGLPTLSGKRNLGRVKGNWLTSSKNCFGTDGIAINGNLSWGMMFTLSKTDYEMFLENYNIKFIYFYDACFFSTCTNLFDAYIDNYMEIKRTSTGGKRQIAKLYLNNLYGKFGTNPHKSKAVLDTQLKIKKTDVLDDYTDTGFVAIASCITANARRYTVSMAKLNKDNFVYADTDSVHCIGNIPESYQTMIDDSALGKWKIEGTWQKGFFVRQKTYIEIGAPSVIKCAGLPKNVGDAVLDMIASGEFELSDFKEGLELDGKHITKFVDGGSAVVETKFKMR